MRLLTAAKYKQPGSIMNNILFLINLEAGLSFLSFFFFFNSDGYEPFGSCVRILPVAGNVSHTPHAALRITRQAVIMPNG